MPTAVWPEIHTVPGMANPVPDIPTPKRGQDLNNADKSVVLYLSSCLSSCCAAKPLLHFYLLICRSRRSRRQDVKYGNPIRQCRGYNSNSEYILSHNSLYDLIIQCFILKEIKCFLYLCARLEQMFAILCAVGNKNTLETVQYGVEGSTTFLECQARSPHMSLKWHLQKENSDRRKEVSKDLISKEGRVQGE